MRKIKWWFQHFWYRISQAWLDWRTPVSASCGYQGYEFGAGYLDSVCSDGFLWDADSCDEKHGLLSVGGDIPCPQCNTEKFIEYHREAIEEQGWIAADDGLPPEPPSQKWRTCGRAAWRRAWLKGWVEGEAQRTGAQQ